MNANCCRVPSPEGTLKDNVIRQICDSPDLAWMSQRSPLWPRLLLYGDAEFTVGQAGVCCGDGGLFSLPGFRLILVSGISEDY